MTQIAFADGFSCCRLSTRAYTSRFVIIKFVCVNEQEKVKNGNNLKFASLYRAIVREGH